MHFGAIFDDSTEMAAHPQVTLDVQLADRVVDLVDEGFDLAVRIARLPYSTLVSRQLASTQLVPCAAPSYLAQRDTPAHPSELAQHDVGGYSLLAMGANGNSWGQRARSASRYTHAFGPTTVTLASLQPCWDRASSCSPISG